MRSACGSLRDKRQKGAVAAELALVLPILLMLLFGMVQLGIAYTRSQAVQGAAREAARVASIPGGESDACRRADDSAGDIVQITSCDLSFDGGNDCRTADRIVVTIQAQTDLEIPFFPGSRTLDLEGVGDFRCE
jgi:Flp pilus assembly protein TadG